MFDEANLALRNGGGGELTHAELDLAATMRELMPRYRGKDDLTIILDVYAKIVGMYVEGDPTMAGSTAYRALQLMGKRDGDDAMRQEMVAARGG
jgi:hypothetical protein